MLGNVCSDQLLNGYSASMTENQENPSTSSTTSQGAMSVSQDGSAVSRDSSAAAQDTSATSRGTPAAAKNPEDWVTGEEPMTDAQASYLATLAQDTGREIPEALTKAQASELIDELQGESPRASR